MPGRSRSPSPYVEPPTPPLLPLASVFTRKGREIQATHLESLGESRAVGPKLFLAARAPVKHRHVFLLLGYLSPFLDRTISFFAHSRTPPLLRCVLCVVCVCTTRCFATPFSTTASYHGTSRRPAVCVRMPRMSSHVASSLFCAAFFLVFFLLFFVSPKNPRLSVPGTHLLIE